MFGTLTARRSGETKFTTILRHLWQKPSEEHVLKWHKALYVYVNVKGVALDSLRLALADRI